MDALFSNEKGGSDVEQLGRALREARGTPGLADACRAYLEGVGPPSDARYIVCFLDAGDHDLILEGLRALEACREQGTLEATPGLRTQLRMLAQEPDDEVAEAAEDLLGAI